MRSGPTKGIPGKAAVEPDQGAFPVRAKTLLCRSELQIRTGELEVRYEIVGRGGTPRGELGGHAPRQPTRLAQRAGVEGTHYWAVSVPQRPDGGRHARTVRYAIVVCVAMLRCRMLFRGWRVGAASPTNKNAQIWWGGLAVQMCVRCLFERARQTGPRVGRYYV